MSRLGTTEGAHFAATRTNDHTSSVASEGVRSLGGAGQTGEVAARLRHSVQMTVRMLRKTRPASRDYPRRIEVGDRALLQERP